MIVLVLGHMKWILVVEASYSGGQKQLRAYALIYSNNSYSLRVLLTLASASPNLLSSSMSSRVKCLNLTAFIKPLLAPCPCD